MITLRNALPSDDPFLMHLYATTRAEEMALTDWNDAQRSVFLTMQFNAQCSSYRLSFPQALYQVIEAGETAIGRLITERREEHVQLIDIALLPEYRNQGIGTSLIQTIQKKAQWANKSISLHVKPDNPALRLYRRLGFVGVAEGGFYIAMKWEQPRQALSLPNTVVETPPC